MIKSRLCDLVGIKYPIIQAGMGPFGTNKLSIASANAGVLGLISSSGITTKDSQREIFDYFCRSGGADPDADPETILRTIFQQTLEQTRESQGIFGINVMVSAEMKEAATLIIKTVIKAREEDPEMKKRFKVLVTSAGDPLPWSDAVKKTDLIWMHVMPSVKAALRCKKAGVDVVVASGHEGGFHTSWEPVHSMILLPAVVEAVSDEKTLVVGAGGFCDGKTLAAALTLGADGAQMGTRFLATEESDFHQIWKEGVVEAGDRGTLIARGFVGPARWLKTPRSEEHARNTLQKSPGVFLGTPDDYTTIDMSLINFETESINAVYRGDKEKALLAAGESAQRINDMPKVKDLVQRMVKEAEDILRGIQSKYLD
ncbi:NAD(P)H-dependent flavin oxidoreductase [Desulfotruncus alcoholivorax]|uniref:NAD(P)H-dependent flavin oxidoreductase n=1 Tax=Desulfotruncus alcoholivorax TaxID=265477 RepID=UPI0003F99918|nr:nitronate monooxygenase [Desulfotruncus alcoholivorax]